MIRSLLVSIAILLGIGLSAQLKRTISADHDVVSQQQIKELEFHLVDLLEKKDVDTYSGYLADDYVRINDDGSVSTKAQVLAQFRSAASLPRMRPHDLDVRVYGNTAILRFLLDMTPTSGAGAKQGTSLVTKVFQKRDARWYMLSLQGTPAR